MDADTFTQLLAAGGSVIVIVCLALKFFSLLMNLD